MHGLAYSAALLVAAVFLRAAVAKLADRQGTARAFGALGLPYASAVVVPIVELGLVVALVVIPGWGAAMSLALLAAFTTFLGIAIRGGAQAGCNCFGSARRAAVSWVDLVRNAMLAAFTVGALAASTPTVPDIGAVAVVAGLAILAAGVLRYADARVRQSAM